MKPKARQTFRFFFSGLFFLTVSAALLRAERPPFKIYTTGEGLAHDSVNRIVRDAAEMNGELKIVSEIGKGTTVGLRLPLEQNPKV
jgi:hypothetical protein